MGDRHAVVLDDVTVQVPRRREPILREVDLQIAPGEQVLVLGASGSGKTTVLHTISGVVPHTVTAELTGSVHVAGHPVAQVPVVELSRHVGVLPQDPSAAVCLPDVEQELALPLENRAVPPDQIGPAVAAALEAVGATHLRERATSHLSGGEAQRVALAAALIGSPEVLLLDEPTSMLDPAGVGEVRRALARAVGRHRPAVLLVEHRLDDFAGARGVAGLPSRAVVMDGATVIADGPTEQVLRDHAGRLRAAGSWLPLEAELYALTGVAGGLDAPANLAFLDRLGRGEDAGTSPDRPPPPAPAVLAARGVTVTRPTAGGQGAAVLRGVDLELRPGEVVALLGPNGVGKTSLLLTLAGLLRAAHGVVEGARPGMVFQNAEHQFVAHTVRDEIAHGLPSEAPVGPALATHRLEHLAGQNPFRLSGGEQRRVSLAAMLAHDRPCLLADEPTLGLDRRDTLATVRALRAVADEGRAVVVSTHDLRTALTLADRAVVLAEGTVLADGPVHEVLKSPEVLERAGLVLPPIVQWLVGRAPRYARAVLDGLDAATPLPLAAGGVR